MYKSRIILLAIATVVLVTLGACAIHGMNTLKAERNARLAETTSL